MNKHLLHSIMKVENINLILLIYVKNIIKIIVLTKFIIKKIKN